MPTNVEATSNIRIVWSLLALTICRSPGMNRTDEIVCSCPGNVFVFLHSFCTSQILMNRSDEQVTV